MICSGFTIFQLPSNSFLFSVIVPHHFTVVRHSILVSRVANTWIPPYSLLDPPYSLQNTSILYSYYKHMYIQLLYKYFFSIYK